MMGERRSGQEALFYEFSFEDHVPADHLLRRIDRLIDFSEVRAHSKPYYSETGRPSICRELMIRMLIAGHCFGIRSEATGQMVRLGHRHDCRPRPDGQLRGLITFKPNPIETAALCRRFSFYP